MIHPYNFGEARQASDQKSAAQQEAEQFTRQAHKDRAEKEQRYRLALAKKITELKAGSVAATVALDLAKGDPIVAKLRMERDIADGVVEAAKQRAWQLQADRKDHHEFINWSMRVNLLG